MAWANLACNAVFCACLATAASAYAFRAGGIELDRIRRALLVITAGYVLSGRMIDRSYYVEYFLIAAVSGAMHRLSLNDRDDDLVEAVPGDRERAGAANGGSREDCGRGDAEPSAMPFGAGFGFVDVCIVIAMTYTTLWFWDYILGSL